ncbi:hypothetical protein MMAG44476_27797 [Mycolicibacterium mageritense DSM 44476 = CIP 104973]|uniref:DUF1828 domain-containing protein n=1 Tax=Mycolicibacterium mageritense TaxID=53462 RepID=A0ABM7HNQ5_MYCME|nr:DUF1828 domain-containing protein [Mycolicibacterium mageritense]MCC9181493.1 DUF1828 domain-containing protein [Mycolicibacterium mageritense]BBX32150.1 hypothetical protein MMAGJ_14320 [Mycolicibacterium mageritense]CDO23305.1 hypothetical protein BN978_03785 [Mycolicibacterium mageritense DSM 44476 = CIP 104973]
MTANCMDFATALQVLRGDISCRLSHDESTLIVTTGRFFSDGDAVELLVRPSDDGARVIISDGGLASARLDLSGPGLGSTRAKSLWKDILAEFGVREAGSRVFVQATHETAAAGISILADACIALDSIHLLTAGERRTFADKVRSWLKEEAGYTVKRTSVVDKYGSPQTVTAVVDSPRGEVIIQGASGRKLSDLRSSLEHAFWVMGGLGENDHPLGNRLTLLESVPGRNSSEDTLRSLVRRISESSYVGSFEGQLSVQRFLGASELPGTRDFVFESLGQLSGVFIGGSRANDAGDPEAIEPPHAGK